LIDLLQPLAAESRNRLCGFFPCALLLAGVLQLLSLQLKLGLALLDLLLAGFFFRLLLLDFFPLLPLEPHQLSAVARHKKADIQSRMPAAVSRRTSFTVSVDRIEAGDLPDETGAIAASGGGAVEITARVNYHVTDRISAVVEARKVDQRGVRPTVA